MPDPSRPTLVAPGVTIRPGRREDIEALCAILAEPSVVRWWGEPESPDEVAGKLLEDCDVVLLVIEVGGVVAGGIEYHEETDPGYRHAGIDVYIGAAHQGKGVGSEAVRLLARFLIDARGHHRLTIDPAVSNAAAIRCYEKVGFRPVGVMRQYERGADGGFHDGLLMDLLRDDLKPTGEA
jgi:aminoglycoside 6'-N-acetyltransferase